MSKYAIFEKPLHYFLFEERRNVALYERFVAFRDRISTSCLCIRLLYIPNHFIFYNNGRTINRYITHRGTCTSADKEKRKNRKRERERNTPSLPHYIELRDTMGSPKHKTGRECSGALLYRRYNSSVMPLFNHRYDRSLHSPPCIRPPERRNPAAPTNVKVN